MSDGGADVGSSDLSEIVLESAAAQKSPASRRSGWAGKVDAPKVTALKDVRHNEDARVSTGIGEFERVPGGGLVAGAGVLVGGDTGIEIRRASWRKRVCDDVSGKAVDVQLKK